MKTLILFYSYGGNTRKIANQIQHILGCDAAEIETVTPYTGSYDDVVDQGQREVDSGFMPDIKPLHVDLDQYDTILLGTPVWWYTFAPAVRTFLHDADLKGKAVYPFAANGGWLGHTFRDMEKLCGGAKVHSGLDIRFHGDRQTTPDREIQAWVRKIQA